MSIESIYNQILASNDKINYILTKNKRCPLRLKLCLYAFAEKLSASKARELLKQYGCEQLYVRNFHDATLTYALVRGLEFEEWLELDRNMSVSIQHEVDILTNQSRKRISSGKLGEYLQSFRSYDEQGNTHTMKYTEFIGSEIMKFAEDKSATYSLRVFAEKYNDLFVENRLRCLRFLLTAFNEYIVYMREKYPIDNDNIFVISNPDNIDLNQVVQKLDLFYYGMVSIYNSDAQDFDKHFREALTSIFIGKSDASRKLFIALIVFFYKSIAKPFVVNDINNMLDISGYNLLDEVGTGTDEDSFDYFILEMIESGDTPEEKAALEKLAVKLAGENGDNKIASDTIFDNMISNRPTTNGLTDRAIGVSQN